MVAVTRPRTARERVRHELTAEITEVARAQLAEHGAGGLSLRAVARELGMVSSALYRYFPSRDDLLTALIVAAYDALGEAAEAADESVSADDLRGRWRATCLGIRGWALAHRHEYALLYGSPVPGYRAPEQTVGPAARGMLALLRPVRAAVAAGAVLPAGELPDGLHGQLHQVARWHAPDLPEAVLAACFVAWTQLYGMIGFELFGHLAGTVDPADEFVAYAVDQLADHVGLPPVATG